MQFLDQLKYIQNANQSFVCVGLDSDPEKIPEHLKSTNNPQLEFNKAIIDVTKDLVCAYKPNAAFYEAQGVKGHEALEETIKYIPAEIPVILDSKRGDIGNTSVQYAKASFDLLDADSVTISPYMGFDSLEAFSKYPDRAIFILVKTSNQTSGEIQNLKVDDQTVYLKVAQQIAEWQTKSTATLGAVVGATYPKEIEEVRALLPNAPLLIPGLGSQGGDAANTIRYALGPKKDAPIVVNSSRGIIYASTDENFQEAVRYNCNEFRNQLNHLKDNLK